MSDDNILTFKPRPYRHAESTIDAFWYLVRLRDFEALSKKLEPKQNELKGQNDEVESLKKQLNTQSDKLNDEARGTLVKQIEQKQKSLERSVQDARDDAQTSRTKSHSASCRRWVRCL